MIKILITLFTLGIVTTSQAQPKAIAKLAKFSGFVKINESKELYVDYIKAQKNKPTVVLLNGLTYSTHQWDNFTIALTSLGIGVLRFDFDGMGETLLKYAPATEAFPVETQANSIKLLLNAVQLSGPYNLVGLSYGGGVLAKFTELYPKDVDHMVMMAPFTEPLAEQDELIKNNITFNKQIFPFNTATDDELYDFFLRQIMYTTYPAVEPIILENPYKLEGAFRLVQGIRKYKAVDSVSFIPDHKLHLVIALRDQYIKQNILDTYWEATPIMARGTRLYIRDSGHKIPEDVPSFSAKWVSRVISDEPELFKGDSFIGNPNDGSVNLIQSFYAL